MPRNRQQPTSETAPPLSEGEILAQICELMGAMGALFPAAQMGVASHKAYARMLKDIPLPTLTVAVDQLCVENKFLPSVAEIREKARVLTSPKDVLTAGEAWGFVVKRMKKYGIYDQYPPRPRPPIEHPYIEDAVAAIGGWYDLCTSENQVADRAHFMKIYDQLVARREADERLLPASRELKQLNRGQPLIAQLVRKKDGNGTL
jgi:hypothetical protein